MIKAEELRIGNLIGMYLKEDPQNLFEVLEVGQTMKCKSMLSGVDFWDIGDFEPIPLTEDWLVKFGFNKNHISYYKDLLPFPTEYKKILVDINQGIMVRAGEINKLRINDELIVLWNCDIRGKIHVHQLQNLFHSLTGKELELK